MCIKICTRSAVGGLTAVEGQTYHSNYSVVVLLAQGGFSFTDGIAPEVESKTSGSSVLAPRSSVWGYPEKVPFTLK